MITLYGIKNCDTVKKALKWCVDNNLPARLHDYRVDGLDKDWLINIEAILGWDKLVNKRSTTWRNLDSEIKDNLNRELALKVLLENPTLIKRPITIKDDVMLLGFNANEYTAKLK
ncbi:ArsC family reductase [Pasteurella atlantica]|uniref:ArsC family reductase n=1 Tax=Pasteurellaceae TaxID=712 RepID=UPI0027700B85|nr:ArsC family reductase [Pasteurella atlantica]MDP8034424.1 ArsC family reductase [Pasteurella atlantica]MDP8036377.1 ArsC family reductase [Pasteurella atlantica]MDP8038331.1 ArsC family reductase [Pasteurella atlantica]MDP8048681.1 ArsC family reductase [Pasteurella atlantica]MDP8050616.1 ArsC family reductase [Pasteurella atlantica]